MKQNVCRKYKYGHCKYGDKCHFRHVKTICVEKNCNEFFVRKDIPKFATFSVNLDNANLQHIVSISMKGRIVVKIIMKI